MAAAPEELVGQVVATYVRDRFFFFAGLPGNMVLMDGPWGRFEEPTDMLRIFNLAEYVLVSILAFLAVFVRRF